MKLYESAFWLHRRRIVQRKTLQEIADECGVSVQTIKNNLDKLGVVRGR